LGEYLDKVTLAIVELMLRCINALQCAALHSGMGKSSCSVQHQNPSWDLLPAVCRGTFPTRKTFLQLAGSNSQV